MIGRTSERERKREMGTSDIGRERGARDIGKERGTRDIDRELVLGLGLVLVC